MVPVPCQSSLPSRGLRHHGRRQATCPSGTHPIWWLSEATRSGMGYDYTGSDTWSSSRVGIRDVWSWSAWKERKVRLRVVLYQQRSQVAALSSRVPIARSSHNAGCNFPPSTRWGGCTGCGRGARDPFVTRPLRALGGLVLKMSSVFHRGASGLPWE